MIGPLWRIVAWIVTRPGVRFWLVERASRTPYSHITSADGTDVYMERFWLFNPYSVETGKREGKTQRRAWWREYLPSVRIHHIRRPDRDRHLHDHPWNARTVILAGWYEEERYRRAWRDAQVREHAAQSGRTPRLTESALHKQGYTGTLKFGEFHRITAVPPTGVWTLFITWKYRGTWGFDVDGRKVPWKRYLALQEVPVKGTQHNPFPQPEPDK